MGEGRDEGQEGFLTPQQHLRERAERLESPRGPLLIASCRSGSRLAAEVAQRYEDLLSEAGSERGVAYLDGVDFRFSDGETCVRLQTEVNKL